MHKSFKFAAVAAISVTLAACQGTDIERGTIGAVGGALAAEATGGDPVLGALAGGAIGVACDDINVC